MREEERFPRVQEFQMTFLPALGIWGKSEILSRTREKIDLRQEGV